MGFPLALRLDRRRSVASGALLGMALAACGPYPWAYGPLAVSKSGTGDMARHGGVLVITESCVLIEWAGQRTLPIWPASRTTWNGSDRSIVFHNRDGSVVTIRNGDTVALGGGEATPGQAVPWLVRPDPSCEATSGWSVGNVEFPVQPEE